jgi:hypothetical protein
MQLARLQASRPSDIDMQTRIRDGLHAAVATRDANLADGREGRLLGGDENEMWFIDSSFVEGVHYAVFNSEEAALVFGHVEARIFSTGAGPSDARNRFWLYNLGAPVSFIWWCLMCSVFLRHHCCPRAALPRIRVALVMANIRTRVLAIVALPCPCKMPLTSPPESGRMEA